MKINRVTITGADDKVHPDSLFYLEDTFPFVEWGILFSKTKAGEPRYPSLEWIDKLKDKPFNLSAHFCGWWAKEVVENGNFQLIDQLDSNFARVQINYNFKNSTGFNLPALFEYLTKKPYPSVILQYNVSNADTLDQYLHDVPSNVHFLYDSSGGRGTEIKKIEKPLGNQYTGYSGGLSPDNIGNVCSLIHQMDVDKEVWIDLESGARTDDVFDLHKVKRILDEAGLFVGAFKTT